MKHPDIETRDVRPGRLPEERLHANFADLHPPLTALQAEVEAARCLFCFDAPCTEACPTGIDIPGFIRKIATGNLHGAAVTILDENIMGGTCANVCPVEELCEQVCVKNTAEALPVAIGRLQRHATDHLFASGRQPYRHGSDTGKRVAVVGAGPAGLACAHRLALHGHEVTVYETRPKAGGLNEYGIAAYKMVDDRAAREVEFILGVGGITLRNGKTLSVDFSLAALRREYDAVFLGLGHNAVNHLDLDHEDADGVHSAVNTIERIRQEDLASLPVGRRVVVIGGGNTAIDIAVQMRKLGAESVTLVYRRGREDMGATGHEQALAQTSGVLIRTWAAPHRIHTAEDGVHRVSFEYTHTNDEGRLAGTGRFFDIDADQVFKAIGQHFDEALLDSDDCPAVENGRIRVDEQRATSLEGVWAGGDCVPGRDLTVTAVQDGKAAADSMHQWLSRTEPESADG
ncbi:NAD(P)-dependent oxidoreductase [Elongatibacter sediminis]|uniref:NAD(P)-dependent oxidoreductase n=1 Tax=Elongatibacter sediminis TaxID=3119006 RepID=A0AAW9RAX7_9GAMM